MSGVERLTQREHEILRCIHAAMTNREIHDLLQISEETVKRHLSNIFDKMGCSNRLELLCMTVGTSDGIPAYRCPGCSGLLELHRKEDVPASLVLSVDGEPVLSHERVCPRCLEKVKAELAKWIKLRAAA